MLTAEQQNERANMRGQLWQELPSFADPIPEAEEFISGVEHKNSDPKNQGQLWNVVRAIASTKTHYYNRLRKRILEYDANPTNWHFMQHFPDLSPASGGNEPLSIQSWNLLQREMHLESKADYLKHILTKHDGEAKLAFAGGWKPFFADVHKACFWQYQFATHPEV